MLAAADRGAGTLDAVFSSVREAEPQPWLSDLATAGGRWRPTALGRRLVGGAALDWRRLDDRERWVGGIRLAGGCPDWRWDRRRGRVVGADAG